MRRFSRILPAVLVAIWLLAGFAAQASETVDRSGKASAKGRVIVENIAGSITVVGWDKKEIKVEGELGREVKELKFKTDKKKSIIKVIYKKDLRNVREGADLTIMIPRESRLEVECVSAGISVSKLKGSAELSSISGEVDFEGWCNSLDIESISGEINIDGGAREMSLESISGEINAEGKATEIEAESVSGSIVLKYETFLDASVETVSGSIRMVGDLDPKSRISCDVVNGSVTLVVPANVSAEFEASTFNGRISNDFGQKANRTSKYAPGKELEFTNGDGDAQVELNSFNGDIKIRKK